jgi:hypothetical protein
LGRQNNNYPGQVYNVSENQVEGTGNSRPTILGIISEDGVVRLSDTAVRIMEQVVRILQVIFGAIFPFGRTIP